VLTAFRRIKIVEHVNHKTNLTGLTKIIAQDLNKEHLVLLTKGTHMASNRVIQVIKRILRNSLNLGQILMKHMEGMKTIWRCGQRITKTKDKPNQELASHDLLLH
jgi:hypothetical protein